MVKAVVDAIDDGAVGEDRGEAAPAGLDHIVFAAHVEKALVLPGEAGGRQIFGGGRTAHGDRDAPPAFLFERAIGSGNLLAQPLHSRSPHRRAARRGGALGEQRHIVMIEIRHQPAQLVLDAGRGERVAIGFGGQRKAVRNAASSSA